MVIKLSNSNDAILFDPEDYDLVSRFKWRKCEGYARSHERIPGGQTNYKMHRLIMGVNDPRLVVDHINGNTLDNRRSNLRILTNKENRWNCHNYKQSSSNYPGVVQAKNKWRAQIGFASKSYHLGYYDTELEAAMVWEAHARFIRGLYGKWNFNPKDLDHIAIKPILRVRAVILRELC